MPGSEKVEGSVEIFCSYSHKDEALRQEFESHVTVMRRQNLVQIWHDRQILAASDWAGDIDQHLNTADIVTLFVSSDFLASDYCYEKEMRRAMERAGRKEALVVPIIVRTCDWKDAPFGSLQPIPTDGRAVTGWPDRDEAWTDVALHLKVTVKEVLRRVQEKIKAEIPSPMQQPPSATPPGRQPEELAWDTVMTPATRKETKRQKENMKRWQILLDTQRKIAEIEQEVTAKQGLTQSRAYKKWSEYLDQA